MRHKLTTICFILCAGALAGRAAWAAELRLQLKSNSVYILPMADGLDHYLASRLTSSKVLWVVVAPEKADAVFTDRLDDAFRSWSRAHYGAAAPQQPPASYRHARPSPNPGTLFLVDPKTGLVLWSTYESVSGTSPTALDQVAAQVTKRLQKSLNPN